MMKYLR